MIDFPLLIGGIITTITVIYIFLSVNTISINKKILSFVITVSLLGTYLYFSYLISTSFIRYALFLITGSIIIKIIYKKNIVDIICGLFFTWIIFLIAEIIVAIVLDSVLKISIPTMFGNIIGNLTVSIVSLVIFYAFKIKDMYLKFFFKIKSIKNNNYYILIIILAISFSIIIYNSYFQKEGIINLILSIIIIIVQLIVTIMFFLEKNLSQNIKIKYDMLLSNLEEYEKMLDYQRVANHENKNQLLVIKGMLKKNEKETIEYIDTIIKEKREENEEFYTKTKRIPSGGLQGLIYYKLLLMKEKNININLNIDTKVRKFKMENQKINNDLCKSIGVIIDNAIQAVENLKEKNIEINMINEENLEIEITNNFSGSIDLGKIDEMHYTTKDSGHGYGLSLLKHIILNNDKLENIKYISGNSFTQKIIVKK